MPEEIRELITILDFNLPDVNEIRQELNRLLELLNQMDGFDQTTNVKVVMATNRADTLDPALLRSGRLDRKVELPHPSETARVEILKIHCRKMKVDYDDVRKYATSTFTAGNRYVSLPSDSIIIRSVEHISGTTRTFLEKRDTSFISEFNPTDAQGTPKYWANWDSTTLIVAPTPDQAYTVELWYDETPERLGNGVASTGTTTTTFVSNNAPEVLLYGVLSEAYSYLKNTQDMQIYTQKFQTALQAFANEQMGRKRRDEYTDGVLRVPLPSADPKA